MVKVSGNSIERSMYYSTRTFGLLIRTFGWDRKSRFYLLTKLTIEVLLLPPFGPHPNEPNDEDDDNNGHGNNTKNAEGNVRHGDEIPIAEDVVGPQDGIPNVASCMSDGNEAPSVGNSHRVSKPARGRKSPRFCKSSRGSKDVEGDEAATTNGAH
jgi:hypothetical protein